MSSNDNSPVQDFGNLLSRIEMEFSLKTAIFSDFFLSFLESTSNFKHFGKKKMIAIPTSFRKLQNVKNEVRPLSKKHRSRTPFHSEHVKQSQTLVKYAWDHFHHIFSSLITLIRKYLPSWYVKFYGCFVTHWLPMTIILFMIVRICRPGFKCKYL